MIACSQNTYNDRPGMSNQNDCRGCPERTSTASFDGRTSRQDCICSEGFFYAHENFTQGRPECTPPGSSEATPCCTCPVGTGCDLNFIAEGRIALEHLPIMPGYFRLDDTTADVRRCPDAAVNCSGESECPWSTSGCAGGRGRGAETCRPGLHGTYCRVCVEPLHFYVAAAAGFSNASFAHCESCRNVAASRSVSIFLVALCVSLSLMAMAVVLFQAGNRYKALLKKLRHYLTAVLGLPNKLKILVGFYQIAARAETVYAITLPAEVRSMLLTLQLTISFGK